MIKLYGIQNCDSCRQARNWLEDHDIDFRFVDIRKEGLDERQLEKWQKKAGWEKLLNKHSATWRKIPSFDRNDVDAGRVRSLIIEFPTVMKRPVLDTGKLVLIGFDESEYAALGS